MGEEKDLVTVEEDHCQVNDEATGGLRFVARTKTWSPRQHFQMETPVSGSPQNPNAQKDPGEGVSNGEVHANEGGRSLPHLDH